MNNIILEFLENYKSLDELCKQILSSDRGISEYIYEMSNEKQGHMKVACWEKDYKQLKKMRWIRNQLVHETNSFQDNLVNTEDIEWLKTFRSRIMESTDPFSLLHQSGNTKITNQVKPSENYFQTNKPSRNWNKEPSSNSSLEIEIIILVGIIIFATIFLTVCL